MIKLPTISYKVSMSRNRDDIMSNIGKYGRVLGFTGLMAIAQLTGIPYANHTPYVYAEEMNRTSEEDVKWQNARLESINGRIDREKMNAYIDRVHKDAEEMLKASGYNVDLSIPCAGARRLNKQNFGKEVAVDSYWNQIIKPGERAVWIGAFCLLIFPEKPELGEPRLQIYTGGYSSKGMDITETVQDIYDKLRTLMGTAYASMIYGIPQEELFRMEPPSSGARVSKGNMFGDSSKAKRAGTIGQVLDNVRKGLEKPEVTLINAEGKKVVIRPSQYRNVAGFYKGVEIVYSTDAGCNK